MLSVNIISRLGGRELSRSLADWLDRAPEKDLLRINLKALAETVATPWTELLDLFLHGVRHGAFQLNWEFHCPHCNAIPDFKHHFDQVAGESFCGLCNVGFRNTLDQNVEVTFSPHEGLKAVSPAAFEAVKAEMMAAVAAGTWSMPERYVSGLEVLANPTYQEHFGNEVLSGEESLSVSRLTFLFTDIKGSTQMYTDLGDTASYRIVREHFKVLFQAVEAQGGLVVKTIGDAIMAVFLNPAEGVRAALAGYEAFRSRQWETVGRLEIKMGLHAGPAIAVNLNSRNDYFGNAVNLAARLQGLAENHSLCLSDDVAKDPEVRRVLAGFQRSEGEKYYRQTVRLKGIKDPVVLVRLEKAGG